MNAIDALQIIYNYRLEPDTLAVPPILSFTGTERLVWNRQTAIPWSGVICAFCERHPECYAFWKSMHWPVIEQAMRLANHHASWRDERWADHLLFRFIVLADDKDAWALLCRAHHDNKRIAKGAQRCIEHICYGKELVNRDGFAVTDTQGTTQGVVQFPDLREQIRELNEEYRRFTIEQRKLPFSALPFSPEFRLRRQERLRLPAQLIQ